MRKVAAKRDKPYSKPTLTRYGTIQELTGALGRNQKADGGKGSMSKTAI